MSMKVGCFYKHPNNTSVCVEVIKVFEIPGKEESKVKVRWWRVKYGMIVYCMNMVETFRKSNNYWKEWKRFNFTERN